MTRTERESYVQGYRDCVADCMKALSYSTRGRRLRYFLEVLETWPESLAKWVDDPDEKAAPPEVPVGRVMAWSLQQRKSTKKIRGTRDEEPPEPTFVQEVRRDR